MRSPTIHKNQTDAFNAMKAKFNELGKLSTEFIINFISDF